MSRSAFDDVRACLRFYSRLPLKAGWDGHSMPDFALVSWAAPLAGAIIGALGGGVLLVANLLGLPPLVGAACAIGGLALSTGALHEDGLADVADGFGGGVTREQKLAIMRDSRLGAYGALVLCLSTLLRVFSLSAIMERGLLLAAMAIVVAGASSRVAGLTPLMTLLPARADGAGSSAATPSPSAMRFALLLSAAIGLGPLVVGDSLARAVIAQIAAFAAAAGVAKLAQRQIGGYTGDVLGAAQQAAEIAVLATFSAS
jgi:adenosylcobinamide-GDP ribazoletransferase